MDKFLCLTFSGVAGTLARYLLSGVIYQRFGVDFPYGTLVVNLIGCFLIGFFDSLIQDRFLLSPQLRLLLMTGFCGAFTTFSTFILETSNLFKDGEPVRALLNVLISVIAGFLIFRLGVALGKFI
ncbi:MAG: fluoride efflux transporter CrcB [Candidatus Omnitrophota bacterium]